MSPAVVLLLVAAQSPMPGDATQFALAAGALDGARLACHMPSGSSSPASVAAAIRALAGNAADATLAASTYAQTELIWLDSKHEICRSFDALVQVLRKDK